MTQTRRQEEADWLAPARRGEPAALRRFYDGALPAVTRLCQRMLAREADVEDAIQNTFARAFRGLPEFRGESSVKTWTLRIAYNECMDVLRRQQKAPEPLPDTLAAQSGLGTAEKVAVQQALRQVTPHHRAILALRYWEDLSYEEIAAVLGLSLPAVKMRLHRARDEFRRYYEGEL